MLNAVKKMASSITDCKNTDELSSGGDCPVPNPLLLPPLLGIPEPEYRAVRDGFFAYKDLPDKSCRKTGTCPVTILLTGNNHSLGQGMCFFDTFTVFFFVLLCNLSAQVFVSTAISENMFGGSFAVNSSDLLSSLANNVLVCFAISLHRSIYISIFVHVLDFYQRS